jgi:hypothetical protein
LNNQHIQRNLGNVTKTKAIGKESKNII